MNQRRSKRARCSAVSVTGAAFLLIAMRDFTTALRIVEDRSAYRSSIAKNNN
jgi:hypothetical protein